VGECYFAGEEEIEAVSLYGYPFMDTSAAGKSIVLRCVYISFVYQIVREL
jgi:hypothetical protein